MKRCLTLVQNNKFEKDYPWHEEDKEVDRIYTKGQKAIDKAVKQWEKDIKALKEKQDKLVSKGKKFSKEYFEIDNKINRLKHSLTFISKTPKERKEIKTEIIRINNEPLW